jgi:hypothetical protein
MVGSVFIPGFVLNEALRFLSVRANNWPPLPKFCPVQPCFYQDINVDIPVEFQTVVKYLYYLWLFHVSLLFANMLTGLLFLFVGGDLGTTFGLALVYAVIFTPASYVCWFRPGYKAFRDDSSFNFMLFFFVFFFQTLVSALYALGIGNMGASGLIVGLSTIGGKDATGGQIFVGVLMIIVGVCFGLAGLADFFMLVRVRLDLCALYLKKRENNSIFLARSIESIAAPARPWPRLKPSSPRVSCKTRLFARLRLMPPAKLSAVNSVVVNSNPGLAATDTEDLIF